MRKHLKQQGLLPLVSMIDIQWAHINKKIPACVCEFTDNSHENLFRLVITDTIGLCFDFRIIC